MGQKRLGQTLLWVLLCVSLWSLSTTPSQAQKQKAAKEFSIGQKNFNKHKYKAAAIHFEKAAHLPYNSLSSVSMYMTGLSLYYHRDYGRAMDDFQIFLKKYPRSGYVDEANYHKGLIMLQAPETQEGGLYLLLNVAEQSSKKDLKQDADNAVNNFLYYRTNVDFLEKYVSTVRKSYQKTVYRALLYQLKQQGLRKEFDSYLKEYLTPPASVPVKDSVVVKKGSLSTTTDLKIAVLLPFYTAWQDSEIDARSLPAIEMLEGMKLALKNVQDARISSVKLKILDTPSDSSETQFLLTQEIEAFHPDVLIGNFFTPSTKAISAFAERENVIQLIPLAYSEELIQRKKNVFLANSTLYTRSKALAEYAQTTLGHGHYLIIADSTKNSERSAAYFLNDLHLADLDTAVSIYRLSSYPDIAIHQLKKLMEPMKHHVYDVLYMPINNEELVSFTLARMKIDTILVQNVLGLQEWQRYEKMDRELLYEFSTTITDSYFPEEEAEKYKQFCRNFFSEYKSMPSHYATQGYDLIRLILATYEPTFRATPGEMLRRAPVFYGLNQDYFFSGSNENKAIQFVQFKGNRMSKLKL